MRTCLAGLLLLLPSMAGAATFSVKADGTGDFGSISAALAVAGDGDTIRVGPGTWRETLDFGGRDLVLESTDGAAATILDASGLGPQVIRLASGEGPGTRVSGFTLVNAGGRGLYLVGSEASFEGLILQDLGEGSLLGGAVYMENAVARFDGTTFSGNVASQGGHLWVVDGILDLVDSRLEAGSAGYGGALLSTGNADVLVDACTFEANLSTGHGGAIYQGSTQPLQVVDSELTGNSSIQGYGSALFLGESTGADITGSTFTANQSEEYADHATAGGAIFGYNYSRLYVADSSFSGNVAYYGGAIAHWYYGEQRFERVVFSENYAWYGAGVIVYNSSLAEMVDSELVQNTSYSSGGGAYLYDVTAASIQGTLFDENISTYGYGGGIYAVYGDIVEVSGSSFTRNRAYYHGGGIYTYAIPGGLQIAESTLSENTALYGHGGGIYSYYYTPVSMMDLSLQDNTAYSAGGGAYVYYSDLQASGLQVAGNAALNQAGGGLHVEVGALVLADADVSGNTAGESGGGISLRNGPMLDLKRVEVRDNRAGNAGGGIYASRFATASGQNLAVLGNEARYGGGIYLSRQSSEATPGAWSNLVLSGNAAELGGGLALLSNLDLSLSNLSLHANSANQGSAIYLYESPVTVMNTILAGQDTGPAVHVEGEASLAGVGFHFTDWWSNAEGDLGGVANASIYGTEGDLALDPAFAMGSLVLSRESPLIDAGNPALLDPDGSPSDIGAYGGPTLQVEDLDGDGFDSSVDCDDADASVHPGATESWYDGINADCGSSSDDDADGDGVDAASQGGLDCDDEDPAVVDCPEEDTDDPGTEPPDEDSEATPQTGKGQQPRQSGGCATARPGDGLGGLLLLLALLGTGGRRRAGMNPAPTALSRRGGVHPRP